jgi:hypothetical protein
LVFPRLEEEGKVTTTGDTPEYINLTEIVQGHSYTGTMPDGGTLVEAKEADYGNFVSGLIRTRYSSDDVEALQGNMIIAVSDPKTEKAGSYKQDWNEFQTFRNDCKKSIKKLLGL